MNRADNGNGPITESKSQAVELDVAEERRRFPRYAVEALLLVHPVDDQGQICGNVCVAQCRNISEGGISFNCNRPISVRCLQLDSTTPGFRLSAATIEVLRSNAEGDHFELAGKFVTLPGLTERTIKLDI